MHCWLHLLLCFDWGFWTLHSFPSAERRQTVSTSRKVALLCSWLGSRTLTKTLPGSEKNLISIYWMIAFPYKEHLCSQRPGHGPCAHSSRRELAVGLSLSLKSPGVFTELRLRAAPSSLSGHQWDQECVPLVWWFGEKTVGFGDWVIPTLILAGCVTRDKFIHHFPIRFPPLLEVGITEATPMVLIIDMNGYVVASSYWMLAVGAHCLV